MIEVIGWIASILLITCGIPQAYKCIKQKHAKGISPTFIWLWTIGEAFGLIYVSVLGNRPLILNYFCNLLICLVILGYVVKGNNE